MKEEGMMFEIDEPYITAGPIDAAMFLNGTLTYTHDMKERLKRIEQLCSYAEDSDSPVSLMGEIIDLAIEMRVLAGSLAYWVNAGDSDKQEDRMWRAVRNMYADIVRDWLMEAHPDENAEDIQ
jgi:hypothetical protein